MLKPLVILGSARSDGETSRALRLMFGKDGVDIVDLNLHVVHPYDYAPDKKEDDFPAIVDRMLAARTIIFATPVYWYSMSSVLKVFFDRFSDLITTHKKTGRMLAGKHTWLLATGTGEALPEGFEVPFRETSEYFDMAYQGAAYLYTGNAAACRRESEAALAALAKKITG